MPLLVGSWVSVLVLLCIHPCGISALWVVEWYIASLLYCIRLNGRQEMIGFIARELENSV